VDILVSKLHELGDNGTPVEMLQLYNFATFDTMAELCFGHPLDLLENNEFSPWVAAIFGSIKMMPYTTMIGYYTILKEFFNRFEPKSIRKLRVEHCKHAEDRVNQRLHEGSDQPDIWNLVMVADGSEKGLTLKEMHSNAELFMIAGSETTGKSWSQPSKVSQLTDHDLQQHYSRVCIFSYSPTLTRCSDSSRRLGPLQRLSRTFISTPLPT
jgi:cytochrome P450